MATIFMGLSLFCFLAMCCVCQARATQAGIKFVDCGSKQGKVSSVAVAGCTVEPCVLKKGSTVQFEVDFTSAEVANKTVSVVHGLIAGVPIPFPLDQPDGCKDSGIVCPLKKGDSEKYTQHIDVKTSYPGIKLIVKWELKDDKGDDLFCIELPVQIQ